MRSQFIFFKCTIGVFKINSKNPEICNKVYRNVSAWDFLLSLISKEILLFMFLCEHYEPELTYFECYGSTVYSCLKILQKQTGNGEICIIVKFIIFLKIYSIKISYTV